MLPGEEEPREIHYIPYFEFKAGPVGTFLLDEIAWGTLHLRYLGDLGEYHARLWKETASADHKYYWHFFRLSVWGHTDNIIDLGKLDKGDLEGMSVDVSVAEAVGRGYLPMIEEFEDLLYPW